jgi:exonuclease III
LRVSNLLRDWKVDIVCLQETKLQGVSHSILRSLWGCSHVDSRWASGGIFTMWDNRVVEKVEECVGVYTMFVTFKNVVDLSVWAFAGVYGPNFDRDRRLLWDELASVLNWLNLM